MLDGITVVLGGPAIPPDEFLAFLRERGREWTAAPLPGTVERGVPRECFRNAFLAVLGDESLRYVEGVAIRPGMDGLGFLHAWCVDGNGRVVDPTWDNPEESRYYGMEFDRKRLTKHVMREKIYGVFGGRNKSARKIFEKGGL
jgi:hypothetical protein